MDILSQKKQRGSALVEFAIGFPFFLFLTFATIDVSLMLIKKTQLDFAFEETINTFAINDECHENHQEMTDKFTEILESNLEKFKLKEDFEEQNDSSEGPVLSLSYCEDTTTSTYDFFDPDLYDAPIYLETELTFKLRCTTCKLIPGIGSSLETFQRNFYQAVNPIISECNFFTLDKCS